MKERIGIVVTGILLSLASFLLIRALGASNPDPILWFEQDSGTFADLYAVTWGGGQYVAVGENGKIATSPDGITWTNRLSGVPDTLYGIAWNGNTFVAVGGRSVISSHDGTTWTYRGGVDTGSLISVAWGNGLFVATGSPWIMISGDGSSWTTYKTGWGDHLGIAWAGSHFYRMDRNYIFRSTDGLGWENVLTRFNSYFRGLCQGAGSFVAVGDEVTCVSSDGFSWVCTPNTSLWSQQDVVFTGQHFVSGGTNVYYSSDGVSWTHSLNGSIYGLAVSTGKVAAVGYSGQIHLGYTDIIFYDGFESGNANAWSTVVPPPTPTPIPTDTPTPLPTDTPTPIPPTDTPTPIPPTDTPTPIPPTATPTPIPVDCADIYVSSSLTYLSNRAFLSVSNDSPYTGYLIQTRIDWPFTESQASNPYIDYLRFEGNCDDEYWHNNFHSDPAIATPPYSNGDCTDANVSINAGASNQVWDAYLNAGQLWFGPVCVQLDFQFPESNNEICSLSVCGPIE